MDLPRLRIEAAGLSRIGCSRAPPWARGLTAASHSYDRAHPLVLCPGDHPSLSCLPSSPSHASPLQRSTVLPIGTALSRAPSRGRDLRRHPVHRAGALVHPRLRARRAIPEWADRVAGRRTAGVGVRRPGQPQHLDRRTGRERRIHVASSSRQLHWRQRRGDRPAGVELRRARRSRSRAAATRTRATSRSAARRRSCGRWPSATRLLHLIGDGSSPTPSPNANMLAYVARNSIVLIPFDGSGKPQVVVRDMGRDGSLAWSPDGTRLAFTSSRGDHGIVGVYDMSAQDDHVDVAEHRSRRRAGVVARRQQDRVHPHPAGRTGPFTSIRTADPWSIWVADASTGKGHEIWKANTGRRQPLLFIGGQHRIRVGRRRPHRVPVGAARAGSISTASPRRGARRRCSRPATSRCSAPTSAPIAVASCTRPTRTTSIIGTSGRWR